MRHQNEEKKAPSLGISKTVATSMIIAAFISFVAMIFRLASLAPEGATFSSYYVPWVVPYGIYALASSGLGTFGLTEVKEKEKLRKIICILGLISGGLLAVSALPIMILLEGIDFGISLLVISACIIGMGVVGIKACNEEFGK